MKQINGLLLINKPAGVTSHKILKKIKNIYFIKKAGLIGILDPLATGLLLICLGKSTKLYNVLNSITKTYKVTAIWGTTTNTFDAYGYPQKKYPILFTIKQFCKIIKTYTGIIQQKIPYFSSTKYKGIPLYKFAIKGKLINKTKIVYISKIKILSVTKNIFKLEISCSQGTYIRSIINEIGNKLKCGAYISKLHRINIGQYHINNSYTINFLNNTTNKYKYIISHDILKQYHYNISF